MPDSGLLFDPAGLYESAVFPPLRRCQQKAYSLLREGYRQGHRNQVVMAPTGAGKLLLGLKIAHEAVRKGRRAIFVCDRTVLIEQASAVADACGLPHGVIQANHPRRDPGLPLQIASVQTLARRGWPPADVVVVDECHAQYAAWVDYALASQAAIIGLSATPFARGLGRTFTNLVVAATMHELVEEGVLTPLRIHTGVRPDMTGAPTGKDGEWADRAVEERGRVIIGDIVAEWSRLAADRKTIVFGATIRHCEELAGQFRRAGVRAEACTIRTPEAQRRAMIAEFRKPDSEIRVLVSVEALSKGFDVPDVSCVCDCRPLRKSLSTMIQMWGRGMRAAPGKSDCLVLDFSGNAVRFMEDFSRVYYEGLDRLDAGEKLDRVVRKEKRKERECPSCGFKPFARRCIQCGFEARLTSTAIQHVSGRLEEMDVARMRFARYASSPEHLYAQCCAYARCYSPPEKQRGRAARIYFDIMKEWPRWRFEDMPDVEVSETLRRKIQSRNIAWAKARAKAGRLGRRRMRAAGA